MNVCVYEFCIFCTFTANFLYVSFDVSQKIVKYEFIYEDFSLFEQKGETAVVKLYT